MLSHTAIDLPSDWVVRFAPLIKPGEVLDLACGGGRHARLLAMRHPVLALDRNAEALAALARDGIATLRHDLEAEAAVWPFAADRFAGIVVTHYLHRPLFPHILASLAPGGVLIYETFAQGNEQFGKPSNPDFLLAPGELLDVAQSGGPLPLRVVAFEEGYVERPRPAMLQRLCATKPDPASPLVRPSLF